jgi:thioesterase domain-containing protein
MFPCTETEIAVPCHRSDVNEAAIPIRRSGSGTPLFMPHCGTGDVVYAFTVAPHITAKMPIYALPPIAADRPQLRTVEAMAARMVQMIRAVQSTGPYRLAGWCFAGTLAYEIAAQLIGDEETVEFVGLLGPDWSARETPECIPRTANEKLIDYFRTRTGTSNYVDIQAMLRELECHAETLDFDALLRKSEEPKLPVSFARLTSGQVRQFLDRLQMFRAAQMQYISRPIPIPIQIFAAQQDRCGDPRAPIGWAELLPENDFQVTPVGGNRYTMLTSPNVEALGQSISEAIRSAAPTVDIPEYVSLCTLQAGRLDTDHFFCVPGAGANVAAFVELAAVVDPSWEIAGFQPRGLDGTLVPFSTVCAAAKSCLRAIEETNLVGHIHLLGHSFGGWVAFEMAQQLADDRRDVSSLTLIDSATPDEDGIVREYNAAEIFAEWVDIFEQMLERPLYIPSSLINLRNETDQLELVHQHLVKAGVMPSRSRPEALRSSLRTFAAALRTRYKPQKVYHGPVHLLLADDVRLTREVNQQNHHVTAERWRQWAPNLNWACVSGNHVTVLRRPHVYALANLLHKHVDTAAKEVFR